MTIQRYILAPSSRWDGRRETGAVGQPARTGRSGRDRIAPACRRRPGLLQQWPASGRRSSGRSSGSRQRLRLGRDQGRPHLRPGDAAASDEHRLRAEPRRRQGRLVEESRAVSGSNDQRAGPARHADGRRRSALRADRERRPGVPASTDGTAVWQRNILKDFGGRNIRWLISESPLVDGNNVIVTPGGRGAGMVALDKMTGQDGLDQQGAERRGGLRVADRRRRPGRAHDDDADGERRRRRARIGRQADVALRAGGQRHRQHRDAGLLRQQSVLHVGLRHRRRAARADARRTARSRRRRSTSRATCRTTTAASCS